MTPATSTDDNRYMKMALDEAARASEEGEVPVGAIVVCKGRVIARAHNLTETLTDVTAHAEMQAVTAAANYLGGKYLNDCTLYVTVEPCIMCAGKVCSRITVIHITAGVGKAVFLCVFLQQLLLINDRVAIVICSVITG